MLKTNYLGLELDNPVIVAAGPWNRDGQRLRESIASGAGAVVTESIVSDTMLDMGPRIACDDKGAQNIRLYSDIQIEGWEREMQIAKADGGIVIGSISAHSPSELAYLASKLEKYGADAIELSVSNPMLVSLEVVASHADVVYEMTKAVSAAIKIPLIVKLSHLQGGQGGPGSGWIRRQRHQYGAGHSGGGSGNSQADPVYLRRHFRGLYPAYGAGICGNHRPDC